MKKGKEICRNTPSSPKDFNEILETVKKKLEVMRKSNEAVTPQPVTYINPNERGYLTDMFPQLKILPQCHNIQCEWQTGYRILLNTLGFGFLQIDEILKQEGLIPST